MVAGRPHRRERMALASDGVINRSHHGAGRSQYSIPAVAIQHRVEEEGSTAPGTHRFQPVQVGTGVDRQERLAPRGESLPKYDRRFLSESAEQHAQPGRRFRVAGPRIVLEAAGVGKDGNRHWNVVTRSRSAAQARGPKLECGSGPLGRYAPSG
jgi:hypothetical protein